MDNNIQIKSDINTGTNNLHLIGSWTSTTHKTLYT